MRTIFTIIILFFSYFNALSDTTSVLFIGNSYTQFNNLPELFRNLSSSAGKIVYAQQNTPGGYRFEDHYSNSTTTSLIASRQWDFVVLQEQSQYPAIDYYRYNSTYRFAKLLDSLIKINNSGTMFYMTWGRRFGGIQCINSYCSPAFVNFFHMQDSLKSAYTEIANILNAALSPVGEAWRRAFIADSNIILWDTDNSHPTLTGSYLAACVFFTAVFNQSPVGLFFTGGLSPQTALFCQNIAYQTFTNISGQSNNIPDNLSLNQNFPNPFNNRTTIEFEIKKSAFVKLSIFDIQGREITSEVNSFLSSGKYSVNFDASELTSGIYFYTLMTESHRETKQMVIIK